MVVKEELPLELAKRYPGKIKVWHIDTSQTTEMRFSESLPATIEERNIIIFSVTVADLGGGLGKLMLVDLEGKESDNLAPYLVKGAKIEVLAQDIVVAGSGNAGTAVLIVCGWW